MGPWFSLHLFLKDNSKSSSFLFPVVADQCVFPQPSSCPIQKFLIKCATHKLGELLSLDRFFSGKETRDQLGGINNRKNLEEGTCSSQWFFISNVDFCQKYLNSTIAYASLLTLTPESIVVECYYFLNNLFLYFLLGQSVLIYRLYFLKPSTSLLFTLLTLLNIRLFGAATDAR